MYPDSKWSRGAAMVSTTDCDQRELSATGMK